MAENKKHHYIPKFYLKRFSVREEGKTLALFNHKNNKYIAEAPLKNQGYENFLYGADGAIENALADMENAVAQLFHLWIDQKMFIPPPDPSDALRLIKRFILFQMYRTPKAGQDIMKVFNDGLKKILKEVNPTLWAKMNDGEVVHENPVLLGLINAEQHEHLLSHLECRFVLNLTMLPLITSDAPIILYNQLMEAADNYLGATGLPAAGLQIFYPIHPRLLLCLYDPTVYVLANKNFNCCPTELEADIYQLNALQYVNSSEQLFFNEFISAEYIQQLKQEFEPYRSIPGHINTITDNGKKKLFLSATNDPHINLRISFLNLIADPESFRGKLVPLRDPSLTRPPFRNMHFE